MSSIVLSGDTSGTVTVAVPAVAGTNTLTLPAVTGNILTDKYAGTVLQVVTATTTSGTSTTSSTFQATGLTVSITPKFSTSKIFIIASFNLNISGSAQWGDFTLYKNSTNLGATNGFGGIYINGGTDNHTPCALNYLDSPATTSSVSYTIYIKNRNNSTLTRFDPDTQTSVITVMEIAA
jgi:hypothetical protein